MTETLPPCGFALKARLPLSGRMVRMAGNTSAPGATVTSRALALLGAFDERHRSLTLTELARRAGLPLPTAHRLVGELVDGGALHRREDGRVRHRAAAVGRGPARAGADRAAPAGLAVPARPVRGDAGHRAPRGPRRRPRSSTWTGCRDGHRCRSSARSAPGCRCTAPASARCCSPTRRPRSSSRALADLTRITPYTITRPDVLRAQLSRIRRDG